MQNFSSTSQINFLEIEVSEEIDIKNLKKFISTSLSLNNKHLTSKDRIYLNYIKELKQYQIFILGKEYKYFDFQVFEQFFDKKDEYNEYNLYICNNFFTLYKNGICYYFQNIDGNIKNNEFLEYINKRFFLEIKSIKEIEKNYLLKKKKITMCVDPDWEPFEIIKDGEHIGIAADLIRLISKKLDTPIELVETKTWQQSLIFSKEKKCDILSFLNETPLRKEWLVFTKTLFEDPNVIVGRNEFPIIKDLSSLENKTIAIPTGTAMHELFEKDFPNLKIVPVETEKEAFTLVEERKVDITVRSLIIAAHTIKKENLFNLKIVANPLKYKNELKIGVLKENILLKDIINKAIDDITKKEQEKIVNEHVSIKIPNNEYLEILMYAIFIIFTITVIILLWNYQLRRRIDIEIKKNSEQQNLMFQQNKKAELGNLIGNISHQWRDSITKIGYINLNLRTRILKDKELPKEFLNESTAEIEKSLDFMSETMQNFLDYYKPSNNISEFEVYDSIKSALSIIDTKIKYSNLKIEFIGDFSTKIEGIRNEWMQVWINLIINAINISNLRKIEKPEMKISIQKNEIIFEDNCGKIDDKLLSEINKEKYSGIGIKMAKEISLKNKKQMIITNSINGAIFKFIEK